MQRRPTPRATASKPCEGPGPAYVSRLRAFRILGAARGTRRLASASAALAGLALAAALAASAAPLGGRSAAAPLRSAAPAAPARSALPAAPAAPAAPARAAGQCDLPDAQPLWIDYAEGTVPFRQSVFGKAGVIAATSGISVSPALRKGGAQTVYWEMKLGSLVGTTTSPADPALIDERANKLFAKAAAHSGCATPLIAINELNGPSTTTPWTINNAQYRANVVQLLKELQALGARPFLLVPGAIYTGGDAAAWWQQVAAVADIVRQVYLNGKNLAALDPLRSSRQMRTAFRTAVAELTEIGIPVQKIGLMLGFQSERGFGGREGTTPATAWFSVVKLEALAARIVAAETGISTVWSWGWGTFTAGGNDPEKWQAACTWLWARDQALCDAPGSVGEAFDADLAAGQIALPDGVQCAIGSDQLRQADIDALAKLTGDPEVAATALFERIIQARFTGPVPDAEVLDAEKAIILTRFRGVRSLYDAALQRAGITAEVARGILADELRAGRIEATLPVPEPATATVQEFYGSNASVLVREVESSPAARWLGGRTRGLALASVAPLRIFQFATGAAEGMRTTSGRFVVKAVGEPVPLGSLPLGTVQPAIRDALVAYARADAIEVWGTTRQTTALADATCRRDDLPHVGSVDLTQYLPYLRLN